MASVAKNEPAALPLAEVLDAYRVMLTSRTRRRQRDPAQAAEPGFLPDQRGRPRGRARGSLQAPLPEKDWFFTYYRDRALAIALGMTPYEIFLAAWERRPVRIHAGRQMPNHWSQRRLHLPAPSSPTGTQCLQASALRREAPAGTCWRLGSASRTSCGSGGRGGVGFPG